MGVGVLIRLLRSSIPAIFCLIFSTTNALAGNKVVDVSIQSNALHGSLFLPDIHRRGPAVILIAGSGPTNRNGSSPSLGVQPDTLKLLAIEIVRAGYPTLIFDKRCVGESAAACPDESSLTIDTYVNDTVSWINFLRGQNNVKCVVIIGHSEGSLIGMLAAKATPICGFVSIAGIGREFGEVVEQQFTTAGANEETLKWVRTTHYSLKHRQFVDEVPPSLAPLYRNYAN
jgi:uncharacterized protein